MVDVSKYRNMLLARQKELNARLHEIEEELESHSSKDWEELAVEREEDEVLEGLGASGQDELVKIEAALARVDEGEFGFCVTCGTEIQSERLDVVPHTPFCRDCAATHA
ncbi:TraR/DksA C4-type zinc finger protein [Aliiroseovarius sp. S2029]|uniref:TraR/DksA family transcriptional regulator n=1 Tax=Aliiroseovarius sp. S2029 TaxID=2936988 RepID=UPI00209ADAAF|nr:TraR/DksA C4-type zinc finger protein [Aliiroseovarius sp. S2029]MCK8482883.1 TraR/DksA C4-type zinc finger protein [Aliiroseovarius sp. S2029]